MLRNYGLNSLGVELTEDILNRKIDLQGNKIGILWEHIW